MRKILDLFKYITLLGVRDEKDFHERKKTQLLNAALAVGVLTTTTFSFVNAFQGKSLLAIINVLLTTGGVVILVINSYKKFHIARLILTFLASILFTANALLYRNGGEYFLIGNLVIIIIYFNDRITIFWLCLLNCLLFIGIKYLLHTSFYYDSVSFGRVIFNISYTLVMISFSLIYFKTVQLKYMQEVEEKNKELEQLNMTKQKLFSLVAHDLRSPIGRLKGSLDMLQKGYIDPGTFRQMTQKLTEEVNELHDMLDNLLKWSMSQFRGLEAHQSVFDLGAFISSEMEA
ncbi:MAG TPA: histidine kinase dimerization/phospho-acceptor domain-containing protein, partial [Sediminibacterium sp.]|nr:histidine kinase dimerization/phospho-acceptor domain-containing protein [Sediminibacterium sp.]